MIILDNAGRGRSGVTLRGPEPDLEWAVEHTWIQRRAAQSPDAPTRVELRDWRILPDASAHLIVSRAKRPGGRVVDRLGIVGARTRFVDADLANRVFSVGVRFRPGVLPVLTGEDAILFRDRTVDACATVGGEATALLRRVSCEEDPAQVRAHVTSFLRGHLQEARHDWRIRATASAMERTAGRASPDRLTARMGVAPRTLRHVLGRTVGLGLKRYARIRRLQEAIRLALVPQHPSWASIAARTGFADQAHLIREFRALLGETPTRFIERGGPAHSMPFRSMRPRANAVA